MALKPDTIQFLVNQITGASYTAYQGVVAQLFSYLEAEIKDNPVYKKYRDDTSKWGNWLDNDADDGWPTWQMPSTMEDGKSSSYFLFWKIANGSPSAAINIRHAISCKTSTYVF